MVQVCRKCLRVLFFCLLGMGTVQAMDPINLHPQEGPPFFEATGQMDAWQFTNDGGMAILVKDADFQNTLKLHGPCRNWDSTGQNWVGVFTANVDPSLKNLLLLWVQSPTLRKMPVTFWLGECKGVNVNSPFFPILEMRFDNP